MDITVYLPDEIGQRAKDAGLKFSPLLREAVIAELDRIDQLEQARDGMTQQTVDLNDRNGDPVRLRFTGKPVGGPEPEVYLTDDGRVVVVFEESWFTFDNVDEFSDWVGNDDQRDNLGRDGEESVRGAVGAVGGRIVVDL